MDEIERSLDAEKIVLRLARTGDLSPVILAFASTQVPGYDPTKAKHAEKQWYDVKGFPTLTEEKGPLYGGNTRLSGSS